MYHVYVSLTATLSSVTWTRHCLRTTCTTWWRRRCRVCWVVRLMMRSRICCWWRRLWWHSAICSKSCSSRTWPSKPSTFSYRLLLDSRLLFMCRSLTLYFFLTCWVDACTRQTPSTEATARAQCASPTDLKVDRTFLKLWHTSGGEANSPYHHRHTVYK